MLYALEHIFRVPQYLLRIVRSYLSDRELICETTEGPRMKKIIAVALGPKIIGTRPVEHILGCDIPYEMRHFSFHFGYGDDIAAVIVVCDTEDIQRRLNQVMRRVSIWMVAHGLSLAMYNTDCYTHKTYIPTSIQVGTETIHTNEVVKYLST